MLRRALGLALSSTGALPFAVVVVGQRNCEDLGPSLRKVSHTWLRREKALTAEKLKARTARWYALDHLVHRHGGN